MGGAFQPSIYKTTRHGFLAIRLNFRISIKNQSGKDKSSFLLIQLDLIDISHFVV